MKKFQAAAQLEPKINCLFLRVASLNFLFVLILLGAINLLRNHEGGEGEGHQKDYTLITDYRGGETSLYKKEEDQL